MCFAIPVRFVSVTSKPQTCTAGASKAAMLTQRSKPPRQDCRTVEVDAAVAQGSSPDRTWEQARASSSGGGSSGGGGGGGGGAEAARCRCRHSV